MFLESSDRSLVMKPSEGGMMGDPFIVANFVESFKPPVLRWSYWHRQNDPTGKAFTSVWGPREADLSLSKYADDLLKFILPSLGLTSTGLMDKI
eukprot:9475196-Pyramimonas_sp.AAC.1